MKPPGGSHRLSPEDRALWEEVKKSVKPLRGRKTAKATSAAGEDIRQAPTHTKAPAPEPAAVAPKPKALLPLAPLDRRSRQRIARGRVEIEARLDLHGMTLERARQRLANFLTSAQAKGLSLALVITGKGGGGGRSGEPGVLRREVPHWLTLPEFRPLVVGFEEAAPAHGGAGALYVRIRRRRT